VTELERIKAKVTSMSAYILLPTTSTLTRTLTHTLTHTLTLTLTLP
jgi:hypothetical protein